MNNEVKGALKYNQFARFNNSQYLAAAVGLAGVVGAFGIYNYLVDQRVIFGAEYLLAQPNVNQIEGESFENHSAFRPRGVLN